MKVLRIIIAVVLTLIVIASARRFGPNRPYEVKASSSSFTLSHEAPRGHSGEGPAKLGLKVDADEGKATEISVELLGRIKGDREWENIGPSREEEGTYIFEIPAKPWGTRYFYKFQGRLGDEPPITLCREGGEPMMVKFKGSVPAWLLILHIVAMFGGFFLLIWSALHALRLAAGGDDERKAAPLAWWAWAVMFIGGVPLGFAMNWYAFGVLWEAFPFGGDVTDNKTQIALIIWGIASLALTLKRGRKSGVFAVVIALVVLALFLIPHSVQVG